MTIAIKGNSQGGVIEANGVAAANVTSFTGLPFCKNKLINGEVTRINQRGFDGNWATKNIWASGNAIAQQELCYGWDMWAKASATNMVQPIEAGNFRPNTVHTISGLNMTTRQETSPASGNWNIVVPQAARNVQVEEGTVATPFEIRPISFELAQCHRYYQSWNNATQGTVLYTDTSTPFKMLYFPLMRAIPNVVLIPENGTPPTVNRKGLSQVMFNTVSAPADFGVTLSAVI